MQNGFIDNVEFSASNKYVNGEFLLTDLSRVECVDTRLEKSSTNSPSPYVRYTLQGESKGRFGYPCLHLNIQSLLPLRCQRCMSRVDVPFSLSFSYIIVDHLPEELEEEDLDWIEPSGVMNIKELVEDEILAALPIAPMHNSECTQLKLESGTRINPFEVLKGKF